MLYEIILKKGVLLLHLSYYKILVNILISFISSTSKQQTNFINVNIEYCFGFKNITKSTETTYSEHCTLLRLF